MLYSVLLWQAYSVIKVREERNTNSCLLKQPDTDNCQDSREKVAHALVSMLRENDTGRTTADEAAMYGERSTDGATGWE